MTEEVVSAARARWQYLGTLGVYYSTAFGLALGLGLTASTGVALLLAVVLALAMSAVTFLVLMYEEDWWNDFRDQNRGLLLGVVGNVVSVGGGVWLGLVS